MFFWHDYETYGRNPRLDRPVQFAGVRTNEKLELVEEPVVLHCKPAPDHLPDPSAVLVHGISPLQAAEEGLTEAEFAQRIHAELSRPNTINTAFNGVAFDHEITRFLFYRCLRDPYRWHWDAGCTRWDIIDLLRAAYALRPEGIMWPRREDDAPSFRLQDIAAANLIELRAAHNAAEDVMAMIEVAKLIRDAQPKLFDYALSLRSKDSVEGIVGEPFVLVSSFIPASLGCASLVAPVCRNPGNGKEVIAYDLRFDPSPFRDLTAAEFEELLFTSNDDLSEGAQRPVLHRVKTNACPFVAEPAVLTEKAQARLGLDLEACRSNYRALRADDGFRATVAAAFDTDYSDRETDVDSALYDGFVPDSDRDLLARHVDADPTLSSCGELDFEDARMPELVFRYRARNFWSSLDEDEKTRWRDHCRERQLTPGEDGCTKLEVYREKIEELRRQHDGDPGKLDLLDELGEYGQRLGAWLG